MTKDEAKNEIKKHLWGWNLKVRDVAGVAPYDLLVNGMVKVSVIASTQTAAENKRRAKNCDILAVVVNERIRFYSKGGPADAEGYRLFSEWVKTPSKIIPGPKSP